MSGSKDRGVQFWDPQTGNAQMMLQGHKNSVISVAPSPTGNMFATGSGDMKARIWRSVMLSPVPYHSSASSRYARRRILLRERFLNMHWTSADHALSQLSSIPRSLSMAMYAVRVWGSRFQNTHALLWSCGDPPLVEAALDRGIDIFVGIIVFIGLWTCTSIRTPSEWFPLRSQKYKHVHTLIQDQSALGIFRPC